MTSAVADDHMEFCGVEARHRLCRPDYEARPWGAWLDMAAAVALYGGGIAVLVGSRGSGKTQLGAEIVRMSLAEAYKPAPRYCPVMDLFLAVRASYSKESGSDERSAVERFLKPCVLVLDEVHDRGETEWEDRMLRYVIDKRYAAMKGTVLIANATKEALLESMGKSVSSRIMETGTFIECAGVNFRRSGETTGEGR